jgi:hypothetical protein
METPAYKLSVEIGVNRFNAEGPEETVKADFQNFLAAIREKNVVVTPGTASATAGVNPPTVVVTPSLDRALLERVFQIDGKGTVSLRLLPPDSQTRNADAALLLLYGYRVMGNLQEVPVMKLNDGLRTSGVSVDRLDRFIGTHSAYYMKGGTRSGGRYTLNNQGLAAAESLLKRAFQA